MPPQNENTKSYPVNITAEYPEKSSRWLALATLLLFFPKLILLLPHIIVLYVLQFLMMIAWAVSQIVVLFVGVYPRGLYDFNLGVLRWQTRMSAYILGLVDKYPPFSLK